MQPQSQLGISVQIIRCVIVLDNDFLSAKDIEELAAME